MSTEDEDISEEVDATDVTVADRGRLETYLEEVLSTDYYYELAIGEQVWDVGVSGRGLWGRGRSSAAMELQSRV